MDLWNRLLSHLPPAFHAWNWQVWKPAMPFEWNFKKTDIAKGELMVTPEHVSHFQAYLDNFVELNTPPTLWIRWCRYLNRPVYFVPNPITLAFNHCRKVVIAYNITSIRVPKGWGMESAIVPSFSLLRSEKAMSIDTIPWTQLQGERQWDN